MKLTGTHRFNTDAETLWRILLDAEVLARITPGISRLEPLSEDRYKAIAEVKLGPVSGSFTGQMEVADKSAPHSFTLKVKQDSRIGNVAAEIGITLTPISAEETALSFDGAAKLSGLLARTGQRVLSGVANTLSGQFFKALEKEIQAKAT
jgi:carbon monoxide dehydrogenase subunit G